MALGCHIGASGAKADRDGVHVWSAFTGVVVQAPAQMMLHQFRGVFSAVYERSIRFREFRLCRQRW